MFDSFEALLFLALIPGLLILLVIYTTDKIEREPLGLIMKLVFFGVISTIPAIILETIIDAVVVAPLSFSQLLYALSNGFLCAAFSEELVKLFFLKIGTWKHREFNYHFDAIVYAVSVSLGFAMLENVLYVFQNGFTTGIMRAICSVPLHAFCGVFMGFHYGNAKNAALREERAEKRQQLFKSFLVPFLIHGAYDALLMYGSAAAVLVFLVYLAALYVAAIKKIRYCSENDLNFVTGASFSPIYEWSFGNTTLEPEVPHSPVFSPSNAGDWVPVDVTRMPCQRRTNGFSVVGFLMGIISYLTLTIFLIPNILSIVFSALGMKRQRNGFAVVGLILGVTSLLFGVLVWVFL